MKCVREHINEKFVEDSDPIRDMGIGIYRDHYLTKQNIVDFLIEYTPYMLGTTKIPEDILHKRKMPFMNDKYFNKIDIFCKKYVYVDNYKWKSWTYNIVTEYVYQLEKMGFEVK